MHVNVLWLPFLSSHEMFIVSTAPGSFHEIQKTKQQSPRQKNTMLVALSLELCRWCRRCRIEFLQLQGAHLQIAGKCCLSDSFHQNESFKWMSAKWQAIAQRVCSKVTSSMGKTFAARTLHANRHKSHLLRKSQKNKGSLIEMIRCIKIHKS